MGDYRNLRWLETAPDNYVHFGQRQRQWAFFLTRPMLKLGYRTLAKLRCLVLGHEWSPVWEHEKFDLSRLGHSSTHCVFCGKVSEPPALPTKGEK